MKDWYRLGSGFKIYSFIKIKSLKPVVANLFPPRDWG